MVRRPCPRHWRRSNRSAEICSETRPTRKITTDSTISSTDELVTCDCVADRPARRANPSAKVTTLIGTKIRSGLKMVMIFSRIRKNFAPSRASLIFDLPDALLGLDRHERHAVARLDERQRRRRRRREAVRQQVQELEQAVAARRAEPGGQIRNVAVGEVARQPVEQRRCRAAARRSPASPPIARRRRARTRRAARPDARASAGPVLAVAVDDQHDVAGRAAGCPSSPPRRCPCCRDAARRWRRPRAPARPSRRSIRRRRR